MPNDSTEETIKHIRCVQTLMDDMRECLRMRAFKHDASKLEPPEKEGFDQVTDNLKGLTYGSQEYRDQLAKLKLVLDHHYEANSHHPEHWQRYVCIICFKTFPMSWKENCNGCGNGQFSIEPDIGGMSLLDLVEMFCDWKAATQRHADGNLEKSIQINKVRFQISEQLARILENTRKEMHW